MQSFGKTWQRWDLLAIVLVVAYAAVAASTAFGLPGGGALDHTWGGVQRRNELRVVVDVGFRPFSWMRDEQVIGLDADLARAIASNLGLQVRFVVTGYDALYDALARDEADMIASALPYTPEASWRARYSSFYFNGGQVLLTRADTPLASGASLAGLRVGALLGTDGDTLLRRQERQGVMLVRYSQYEHERLLLRDLQNGLLDAVVLDNAGALTAVAEHGGLRIVEALTFEPYVLAVPPEAYVLHEQVNAALATLERNGCLTALNERWMRHELPADNTLPKACNQ